MISIILNILFYGFLGTVFLVIVIKTYSKYGILGVIRFCLVVFVLPAWIYAIYRLFDNSTHVMSNHLQGAGKGLFDMPFIVSIFVIAITLFIEVVLYLINEEERKRES